MQAVPGRALQQVTNHCRQPAILSSWRQGSVQGRAFATGCARYAGEVVSFQPHAVVGVDWTSLQPYYELAGRLHPPEELDAGALPFVYLVYR